MKFLLVASVLLVLARFSEQAPSYCYNLQAFQGRLLQCLNIVLAAELNDLSEDSIESYCETIQRGASCMDEVVDRCEDAFPRAAFRQMKGETAKLSNDYTDMCKELEKMSGTLDDKKRSLHKTRSTATISKLMGLLSFK